MYKLYVKKVAGSPYPEFIHSLLYRFIDSQIDQIYGQRDVLYNNSSPHFFVLMSDIVNFEEKLFDFLYNSFRERLDEYKTECFFNESDALEDINAYSLEIDEYQYQTIKPEFVSFRNRPSTSPGFYLYYNYEPLYQD